MGSREGSSRRRPRAAARRVCDDDDDADVPARAWQICPVDCEEERREGVSQTDEAAAQSTQTHKGNDSTLKFLSEERAPSKSKNRAAFAASSAGGLDLIGVGVEWEWGQARPAALDVEATEAAGSLGTVVLLPGLVEGCRVCEQQAH